MQNQSKITQFIPKYSDQSTRQFTQVMKKWRDFLTEGRKGLSEFNMPPPDPGEFDDEEDLPEPGQDEDSPDISETCMEEKVETLFDDWKPVTSEGKLYKRQLGALIGKENEVVSGALDTITQDAEDFPDPGMPRSMRMPRSSPPVKR